MTIALDTNVLVRFLVRDDEAQYQVAECLVADAVASREPLLVVLCALMETEWVLRSRYRLDQPSIHQAFERLLESAGIVFEDERVVTEALVLWAWEPSCEFADCLLNARAAQLGADRFLTLDAKASRLPRAERLVAL